MQTPYGMSEPTAFEPQLYFHALVLTSGEVGARKLDPVRISVNDMLVWMTILLVQKG